MAERPLGDVGDVLDAVFESAARLGQAARDYLASEPGREVRRRVATAVIVGAPILSQLPAFRRGLVGRVLGTAAVAAVLVKGAEWLRDWEPAPPAPSF